MDRGIPRVLAFHTEKLHDELVWRRVQQVAHWMAKRDMKATFFVYPFRAQVVGADITNRVEKLAALGHEIGQHTHFYAGTKVNKPEKVNDLTDTNIARCIYRDFERLQKMGFRPKGFTSGAWFVNRKVLDTLVELGFIYDCSAKFPKPGVMAVAPLHRWIRCPQFHSSIRGRTLCVPTTCSLGEWFRWGRRLTTQGRVPYQLIYIHDYDLSNFRNHLALYCFLRIFTCQTIKPLANIAQEYLFIEREYDVIKCGTQIRPTC